MPAGSHHAQLGVHAQRVAPFIQAGAQRQEVAAGARRLREAGSHIALTHGIPCLNACLVRQVIAEHHQLGCIHILPAGGQGLEQLQPV